MIQPRKKRFQFRLRTLLGFTAVAAIVLFGRYLYERSLLAQLRSDLRAMDNLVAKEGEVYKPQHWPACQALGLNPMSASGTYIDPVSRKPYPLLAILGGTDAIVIHDHFALIGTRPELDALATHSDELEKAYAEYVIAHRTANELAEKCSKMSSEISALRERDYYFFRSGDGALWTK